MDGEEIEEREREKDSRNRECFERVGRREESVQSKFSRKILRFYMKKGD